MICKKILIIDDDESIRESLTDVLSMEGYEVVLAEHGLEALNLLEDSRSEQLPGMIILDMMMPVMDGITFLKNFGASMFEKCGKIPVIVASANSHLAEDAGIRIPVARIKKPFDVGVILDLAHKHCGDPK